MSTVYMTLFSCPLPKPALQWNGKKTVVITGANRGIGLAAAKMLAETDKWNVVIACRSEEKAQAARLSLGKSADNVDVLHLDLSDLESVSAFASQWGSKRLDCLALNAGIHTGRRSTPLLSAQGHESTVAMNHLGHFKLMKLLLPNVERTAGRVVFVASSVHQTAPGQTLLGDMAGLKAGFKGPAASMISGAAFDSDKAYRDSKLCNILTTLELARRLKARNSRVTCNCLSPGLIPTTGLFREYNPFLVGMFNYFMRYIMGIAVTEEEGGRRLAHMIDSEELANVNGAYYGIDKKTRQFTAIEPSEEARDEVKAKELWDLSKLIIKSS